MRFDRAPPLPEVYTPSNDVAISSLYIVRMVSAPTSPAIAAPSSEGQPPFDNPIVDSPHNPVPLMSPGNTVPLLLPPALWLPPAQGRWANT